MRIMKMMTRDILQAKYLYKFLKKNKCLPQFVKNIYLRHPDDDKVNNFKKLGDTKLLLQLFKRYGSSINQSFLWVETNEGYDFWANKADNFEREFAKILFDYAINIKHYD